MEYNGGTSEKSQSDYAQIVVQMWHIVTSLEMGGIKALGRIMSEDQPQVIISLLPLQAVTILCSTNSSLAPYLLAFGRLWLINIAPRKPTHFMSL